VGRPGENTPVGVANVAVHCINELAEGVSVILAVVAIRRYLKIR
jgi:hypothetical protein